MNVDTSLNRPNCRERMCLDSWGTLQPYIAKGRRANTKTVVVTQAALEKLEAALG